MKYKVGDKVKIREDLEVGRQYGADDFARGMEQYKGKTATITAVYDTVYHINVDNNDGVIWHWTDEMFEDIPKFKFNVDDKVRFKRDLEVGKKYSGLTLLSEMYKNDIMTIELCFIEGNDVQYLCKESHYYLGEDMLEKIEETKDNEQVRTVDVGFHLDYCGHKVLENVWQGGWADECEERSVFFTTYDCKNQYTLPLSAIDWVIPHED